MTDAGADAQRHVSGDERRRPLISRVRAALNYVLFVSFAFFVLGWLQHWRPEHLAPVGLVMVAAFLLSFVAILIENRLVPDPGEEDAS